MSDIEARTVRPRATGSVSGKWREQFGDQRVHVTVDPGHSSSDAEFRVNFERRWGPQLGDTKAEAMRFSRQGAVTLRDALNAALEWGTDDDE